MRIGILAFGLVWAAILCAQHRRFSWQDACFKNPGAPYCPGHDVAVKRSVPAKEAGPQSGVTSQQPSGIVACGVDWRFADPFADALAGFNFRKLSSSSLARGLIAQLGANQGLTDADMQKIFRALTGADQVALSVHDNRVVFMVTGRGTDSIPVLEPGWKSAPVGTNAVLVGHTEAVNQAIQRIATEQPPAGLTSLAEERRASSEFWAVGSGGLAGPQAVSAGVNGFSLAISIQDRLTSDLAFEFNKAPDASTIGMWAATFPGAALKGNMVLARASMEAGELQQKFGPIAASPLGQSLAPLIKAARHLPAGDTTETTRAKPVIYGLE
jgi:hypothetical protein